MKIQRTIPPAAALIGFKDLLHGLAGLFFGKAYFRKLEKELKQHFGVNHVFLVSSGKAALTVILNALKTLSPEKQKALIPAYTCFSVPSAVVKSGLKVSACDLNPADFDFNYELLHKELNEEILCVIATHLFGIPADIERLNTVCKPRGIFVVEDAAQAMGGSRNAKKLGTIGDVGFFSLGRGKNITCGSGGIIVTNNDRIASAIGSSYSALKQSAVFADLKELLALSAMKLFLRPELYWFPAGLPGLKLGETIFYRDFPVRRMSGWKAGVLRRWQERLTKNSRTRREAGSFYGTTICGPSPVKSDIDCLRYPVLAPDRRTRDLVFSTAKALGISLMYPAPVNQIPEIKDSFFGRSFPAAGDIAQRLVALPTHGLLRQQDRESVSRSINGRFPTSKQLLAAKERAHEACCND